MKWPAANIAVGHFFLPNFFTFGWPAAESLDLAAGHFFLPIFFIFSDFFDFW